MKKKTINLQFIIKNPMRLQIDDVYWIEALKVTFDSENEWANE